MTLSACKFAHAPRLLYFDGVVQLSVHRVLRARSDYHRKKHEMMAA